MPGKRALSSTCSRRVHPIRLLSPVGAAAAATIPISLRKIGRLSIRQKLNMRLREQRAPSKVVLEGFAA